MVLNSDNMLMKSAWYFVQSSDIFTFLQFNVVQGSGMFCVFASLHLGLTIVCGFAMHIIESYLVGFKLGRLTC